MKILFLGDIYPAEMSLIAELKSNPEHDVYSIISVSYIGDIQSYAEKKPIYANIPKITGAKLLGQNPQKDISDAVNSFAPDIIMVRCWTPFVLMKLKESVFWKIESPARMHPDDSLPMILPGYPVRLFLTQNPEEVEAYKKTISGPVDYLPRCVSRFWEMPAEKTMDVMVSGTCTTDFKIQSYTILSKLLCERLPRDSVKMFVHMGRKNIKSWAARQFQPIFMSEQGVALAARAKIYVSPIATRYDPGDISHKTTQAMACRTLVVTHRFNEIEKYLGPDGENLVYADTPEESLDKVRFYLKNDKAREDIAERGYRFMHSEYSWDKHLKRIFKDG